MNPSTLILRLRLHLQRLGLGNLACLMLLLLAALFWLLWLPHLRLQRDAAKDALNTVDLALKKPVPVTPKVVEPRQTNLDHFYKTLGEKQFVEEQLKTLFAMAKKQGLSLASGEYKPAIERNGNYLKYQIILPLKGNYNNIRQFGEQALLTIPFASLDELSFKRDNISNRVLEAKLRLTLYLLDDEDKRTETEAKP
jgi:hypothetical protein